MNSQLIFVPILAHICLVLALYTLLLVRKIKAAKTGEVDVKATALNCKLWPKEVLKVSNNLDNQFEAPLLFYAVCFVLYHLDAVNTVSLILAWFFVFSRYLHAFIHTGSNYVPWRMRVFAAGLVSLVALLFMAMGNVL